MKNETLKQLIPKVEFEAFTLEDNIQGLQFYILNPNERGNIPDFILSEIPSLKEKLDRKGKESEEDIIKNWTTEFYIENKVKIDESANRFQEIWNPMNNKYMQTLSDILDTEWKDEKIMAYVTINPLCPRDVYNWYFHIFYNFDEKDVKETVAHETQHFLFFKKFGEVFPEINQEEYDEPHLPWILSEILAPAILLHPRIKEIIAIEDPIRYIEWDNVKIGDKTVNQYFKDWYLESVENGVSFEEFIKNAYAFAKEHENEIMSTYRK